METTRAIVLRKTKLTESSLIVSWLTEKHGRVKTVAKGARKLKGAFAGQIDLFYLCEVSLRQSTKSDLHTLTEARLIESHAAIRENYLRLLFASYASELIELATEPEHQGVEFFSLMQRLLGHLAAQNPNRRSLSFFEFEMCRVTGILPENESRAGAELLHHFHRLPASRSDLIAVLR